VNNACCGALKKEEAKERKKVVEEGEYLFDSIRDLCLVTDVTRVKRSVIVALNDVKNGYGITAGKQSIYNVAAKETAATDDEESVAVHDTMEREIWAHPVLPFFDAIT
jgi:hypothetical protein